MNDLPRNKKSTIDLLHFNSRSVVNKWTETEAELQCTAADIVCISETWVFSNEDLTLYQLHSYSTFGDCRRTRRGSGVIICVKQFLRPLRCGESECHDIFSICSVKLLRRSTPTIVIATYRPLHSSIQETQLFFDKLKNIFDVNRHYTSFVLVGDFKILRD